MKIKTQEQVAADETAVLMCNTVGQTNPFDDNVAGVCAECGTEIYWRPHNPPNMKRVCVPCGLTLARNQEEPVEFAISETTADELRTLRL